MKKRRESVRRCALDVFTLLLPLFYSLQRDIKVLKNLGLWIRLLIGGSAVVPDTVPTNASKSIFAISSCHICTSNGASSHVTVDKDVSQKQLDFNFFLFRWTQRLHAV
jgi:hypothetical protein